MVDGHLVPIEMPLMIRDLGEAGFSTESSVPFPPGSHHHFRFTTLDQTAVAIEATVVHCRLARAGSDGQFTYITGFEFHSDASNDASIAVLVDTLASVLALD